GERREKLHGSQRRPGAAVLRLPSAAPVDGLQDHAVVADGPTLALIEKCDGSKRRIGKVAPWPCRQDRAAKQRNGDCQMKPHPCSSIPESFRRSAKREQGIHSLALRAR